MSETFFPVNDLLRRRLQTGLTVAMLTFSVASTLFLLLFSARLGFGIAMVAEGTLTFGVSVIFSQFLIFLSALIFAVGAVITSFVVFLMMKQRMRDFGLIKAAGCPNSLVFSYFIMELLLVTLAGCVLGVIVGFAADFASVNIFGSQLYQNTVNLWLIPVVFVVFFVLSIIFGARPLLAAAKASPVAALSSVQYFGLEESSKFKALSRFGLTLKLSSRSLFRRQSASVRIVVLLSVVFVLLTVSICGGFVALDTTTGWIETAGGKGLVAVAHSSMAGQYKLLLGKFSGATVPVDFNYLNADFAVPEAVLNELAAESCVAGVDARLVLMEQVQELSSYQIDPGSLTTHSIGGNRVGESLIIGVAPECMLTSGFVKGDSLNSSDAATAVVGDTLAHALYSPTRKINLSDPLLQNILVHDTVFDITGVMVDPLNGGNVTYVPLKLLQNATDVSSVNVVFVRLDDSADRAVALAKLQADVAGFDSDFVFFEVNNALHGAVAFMGSMWAPILFLPLFALVSAALCMVGYVMLSVEEQRHEFAVLRATGVKPKAVTTILAVQSLIVLLSSCAVGIALGVITVLMILVPAPVVTSVAVFEIAALMFAALAAMFLLGLYPAVKFARKPVLEIMS